MAQFAVPLPRYDGRGSFRRFRSDFECFCVVQSLDEEVSLNCLSLCLDGVAREALDAFPRPLGNSVSTVLDHLATVFPDITAVDSHCALQTLKFSPETQPLDTFIVKLRSLVTAVFGTEASTSSSQLFHYFLAALPQRLAHAVVSTGCVTFEEAVKCVRNAMAADRLSQGSGNRRETEHVRVVDGSATASAAPPLHPSDHDGGTGESSVRAVSGPTTEPQILQQILRRIEQLELQLAAANRAGNDVKRSRYDSATTVSNCLCCGQHGHSKQECRFRGARCFRCGRVGHMQRTCFSGNAEGEGALDGRRAPQMQDRHVHE